MSDLKNYVIYYDENEAENETVPDVPDNFKKYKTKTIMKNIIFSKSKYDLKTRY